MSFAINVEQNGKIKRRRVLAHFGQRIIFGTMMMMIETLIMMINTTKTKKSFMIQRMSILFYLVRKKEEEEKFILSTSLFIMNQHGISFFACKLLDHGR